MPHKGKSRNYPSKPGHPKPMPGRRVGQNPSPGTPRKVGRKVK